MITIAFWNATSGAQQMLAAGTGCDGAECLTGKKLAHLARPRDLEGHDDRSSATIKIGDVHIHVRAVEPFRHPSRRSLGDSHDNNPTGNNDQRAASSMLGGGLSRESRIATAGDVSSMIKGLHFSTKLHARGLPLLLSGESGTGKTQLARELHNSGPHHAGGFVAINCAAIPHDLIESELFGYRAGAFTGSDKQGSPGRFVAASNGTLFLDEIGDMPIALQGRLLQVLSEGEFVPVGGTETVRVRFALISATPQDLRSLVQKSSLREDLYYRLAGATVQLHALRARPGRSDVIERIFSIAASEVGWPQFGMSVKARRALTKHHWPGNFRELHHVARFAFALSDTSYIDVDCLPPPLGSAIEQLEHEKCDSS